MLRSVSEPRLLTLGVIARKVRAPQHRIRYVLATRPHIRPVAWAGNARLFDSDAVAMVRHELNAIDARRAGGASEVAK
jgi:hypothetical protein